MTPAGLRHTTWERVFANFLSLSTQDAAFSDALIGSTGTSYTQASYPALVTDCFGRTLTFRYPQKECSDEVREYMPLHAQQGDIWAHQDQLSTLYLKSIAVASRSDPLSRRSVP